MTWYVTTEVDIRTKETEGYMVEHPTQNFPLDLLFVKREDAEKLAKWLNKKENWIDRLELIVDMETDIDIEKLKEKDQ